MAGYSGRPGPDEYYAYYEKYVARVPPGDLIEILASQISGTLDLLDQARDLGDHAYEPGKWTVKQVAGHLADVERVMSHRALRFGRGDAHPLPSFEQDDYVPTGRFELRSLTSLAAELRAVRAATVALFDGFPPEAWTRRGIASDHEVSVRALACIVAGHELHHCALLRERYLPMIRSL